MGAWGVGVFENDDAEDWLVRFESIGPALIEQSISEVLATAPEYLERDVGASALVAAELIAALSGRPGRDLPPLLTAWLAAHAGAAVEDRLVVDARRALDFVADPEISEIAESRHEGRNATRWLEIITDLRVRLQ